MKKSKSALFNVLRVLALGLAFAAPAIERSWALEATQCSNSDSTLVRVEEEVWGENDIHWKYFDKRLEKDEVKLHEASKKLQKEQEVEWMGIPSQEQTYIIDVELPDQSVHAVLCRELKNDALD